MWIMATTGNYKKKLPGSINLQMQKTKSKTKNLMAKTIKTAIIMKVFLKICLNYYPFVTLTSMRKKTNLMSL